MAACSVVAALSATLSKAFVRRTTLILHVGCRSFHSMKEHVAASMVVWLWMQRMDMHQSYLHDWADVGAGRRGSLQLMCQRVEAEGLVVLLQLCDWHYVYILRGAPALHGTPLACELAMHVCPGQIVALQAWLSGCGGHGVCTKAAFRADFVAGRRGQLQLDGGQAAGSDTYSAALWRCGALCSVASVRASCLREMIGAPLLSLCMSCAGGGCCLIP